MMPNEKISQDSVRSYFKGQGYTTATKNRVSVDELLGTFRSQNTAPEYLDYDNC